MNKNGQSIIAYNLDVNNPPVLTQKQQAMLDALASMPDAHIDYSDISAQAPQIMPHSFCPERAICFFAQGGLVSNAR